MIIHLFTVLTYIYTPFYCSFILNMEGVERVVGE